MNDPIEATASARHLPISGLRQLADDYDAFLVDSYGVLHDGNALYAGSADCLERLRASGRSVVILTNTPRRASTVAREIEKVGITPRHYDFLVSAGEVTFRMLSTKRDELGLAADDAFYYIGPPRTRELLAGLPFAEARSMEDASFLLITGLVPGMDQMAEYDELLRAARARGLPAICANPDVEAIRAGQRGGAAGTIALAYQEQGGTVRYFGKPFPEIYDMAIDGLPGIARSRILCVGDALHTDISGGQNAGLDCLFVAAGIHHDELAASAEADPVGSLFHAKKQRLPTASIDSFCW
jgi:HAD superfamily hydrolase (TIGR01459 family)